MPRWPDAQWPEARLPCQNNITNTHPPLEHKYISGGKYKLSQAADKAIVPPLLYGLAVYTEYITLRTADGSCSGHVYCRQHLVLGA